MSDFSIAVDKLAEAAAKLWAAAEAVHTISTAGGGGATPNLGGPIDPRTGDPTIAATWPGGVSGVKQLQALNQALGQTPNLTRQAGAGVRSMGDDLRTASTHAQDFLGSFAQSQIRSLGFNLLQNSIQGVVNEAQRFVSVPAQMEEWGRAAGDLDSSTRTFDDITTSIGNTRTELESLVGGPSLILFQQQLDDLDNTANRSRLEEFATGVGDAFGRMTQADFRGIDAGLAVLAAEAENLKPLVDTFQALGIGLPSLPGLDDAQHQIDGLNISAKDWAQSMSEVGPEIVTNTQYLARLNSEADDIRANYQAQVQPLRDQLDLLNSTYEKTRQLKALNDLNRNIAQDQLLAQDVLSSAGQAANQALPDELARRDDLQAQLDHQAAADAIQARIDAAAKDYSERSADNAANRRTTQRQLNDARQGISIEQREREANQFAAAQIGAAHVNDPHDTTGAYYSAPGYDNPAITSGGSFTTANFTLIVNGSTVPTTAGIEAVLRQLLKNPAIQTLISQSSGRR